MKRLEVSCAVRHIYIYVVSGLRVNIAANILLRKVGVYLPGSMVSHSRIQLLLQSPLLEYTLSQGTVPFVTAILCMWRHMYVLTLTTVLTQAVVREWSAVCYLDEVVFHWTLNTSKRKCWKWYFSVACSSQQLKRGNWFTGYLATQPMWSGAGTICCSTTSVFLLSVSLHRCSMLKCNSTTTDA
jgi:hypothetical protein